MGSIDAKQRFPRPQHLGDVIRSRRDQIVKRWRDVAGALPHARTLDSPRLVDHIPDLLDRIAAMTEELANGHASRLGHGASELHALARLEEGFDITDVIAEFRVLRDVVFETFKDPSVGMIEIDEMRVLNGAIDTAIQDSVERYSNVRERTLQGFDRIGAAALESKNLDDLLRRLLQVLHDTTPAIDTSSIYLLEGDVLRVRAAVGMGHDVEEGLSMRVGEGFAGMVAQRLEPMSLHEPTADQVRSETLARAKLRVLHGVPIMEGQTLFGVAKIGSQTADEFSLQDQRIFSAMVARASAAILQHVLRERAQQAAERLAESERQLRALADNIPQLAWMADANGFLYWYNQRWYEYTGTTLEQMTGWGWEKVHHPDHLERVTQTWQRALQAGERWEDVFPLRGKDGFYRWFLSRAVPIRDASGTIERWFGTNTDVTARRFLDDATKLLNRSLEYRETLEELAQLIVPDLADWCIVDLQDDGRLEHVAIAHANPSKLALAREYELAFSADLEHEGGAREVMRTGAARIAPEITDEMLAASTQSPERLRLVRELGLKSWIGAPLIARGHTIGVIHLVMSDSGRRYSAADVEVATELGARAGAAVENARLFRDAQAAVKVREDVLAIVSHDLRSPLGAIDLGATLLLQQIGSDPHQRKHLEAIRRSTDRMEHLIDDLLDMASINVGKFSIQPLHVDAGEVLDEAVDMHESIANERGIKIVRESELRGVPLYADRNRLVQVFGNLLGNALKFCKPGDVVVVQGTRDDDHVHITVADTGPGIPKGELPHVFEPYWSGRAGKKKGTGLGLFITRAIVEAHGGAIDVDSEEGKGAKFAVTLPVSRSSGERA